MTVPSSIPSDCSSNAATAINNWIESQPDGRTLRFPSGSCYLLSGDQGIWLVGRSSLTLEGSGSSLRLRTSGSGNGSAAFFIERSDHITIRGFSVDGGNATIGTPDATAGSNYKNGAAVRVGSRYIEFDSVRWDRLYGFGVYIATLGTGSTAWPADISIHDSYFRGGSQVIAVIAGRRIDILNNSFVDTVGTILDLEPDDSAKDGGGFEDVRFQGNTIDRFGSYLVAANPDGLVLDRAIANGLTVTGNHIIHGATTSLGNGGLVVRANKSNQKNDFVIANNRSDEAAARSGPVIDLVDVHNLTVTGNVQPITNGATFLKDSGTSGTRTVSGNDTTP